MRRVAALGAILAIVAALAVHPSRRTWEYHPGMASVLKRLGAPIGTGIGVAQSTVSGVGAGAVEPAPYAPAAYDPGPSGYVISGPPPVTYDVYADPAYLAFQAALDQQQASYGADLTGRMGQVDAQLNTLLPRIAEQGVLQRDRINGSAEARGMFRSGERLKNIGLQQQGETQRVTDAQTQAASQKSAMQSAYQQQLADLARQRAEKVMELNAANAY